MIPSLSVSAAARDVVSSNRDRAIQAWLDRRKARWFVGQVMKELDGAADPKIVLPVVTSCIEDLVKSEAERRGNTTSA